MLELPSANSATLLRTHIGAANWARTEIKTLKIGLEVFSITNGFSKKSLTPPLYIIVQYKMNDHLTLSLLISILRRNFDSIISFLRTIL
ncbi:hypothetical protein NQ317_011531 [Molorchus minor]|uniref:Uncharacterized protein n=1 Tax=Molorchus minor TaxID=1323400 RepID=A0ABQ9K6T9_9CUCU|nr:hypothetical protein NQ317_011531 [Molorchus minor]